MAEHLSGCSIALINLPGGTQVGLTVLDVSVPLDHRPPTTFCFTYHLLLYYQVSIDGHKMTVVGTDSCEVEPVEVDSVFLAIGERVNVLVNASQTPGKLTLSIYYLMKLNRQGMKAF